MQTQSLPPQGPQQGPGGHQVQCAGLGRMNTARPNPSKSRASKIHLVMGFLLWFLPMVDSTPMGGSLVRALPEHLQSLDLPPEFASEDFREEFLELAHAPALLGVYGRTWLMEKEPLAVMGVMPRWQGVGSAWAYISDAARERPKSLLRIAQGLLWNVAHIEFKMWRVDTTVRANYPAGKRFALHLGFACEGLMRAYGKEREDHWLMARVF